MKSFSKSFTIAIFILLSAATLFFFQNCSNAGLIAVTSESSLAPMCREMDTKEVIPSLLYAWDYNADIEPTYKQVMAAPVVGDIDGDKIPEIAFTSFQNSRYSSEGVLRVLNGKTGASKFSISEDSLRPFATMSPLLIDLDGDGKGEIIYLHYNRQKIIALNSDGSLRWEQQLDFSGTAITKMQDCRAGFAAADLDKNGKTEIITGSFIISEDANKRPSIRSRLEEVVTSCSTYAASLDTAINSPLSIIGSKGIMDAATGKYRWNYLRPGYPSTANILPDVPGVEVVVTGSGYLTIYNGLTGAMIVDKQLSEHSELVCMNANGTVRGVGGGQATIGDFDGIPSTLEIAVATGKSLTIFSSNGDLIAGSDTQDCSSLATGLTSFDFNGDKKPEIIYADEQYVRIYEMDGSSNLKVIWSEINPTGTLLEYPVVADVTGDGYAKLIVVSNNFAINSLYASATTEVKATASATTGLRVFAPTVKGSWMPTRSLWNQFAYMGSNVNDNLTATASTMVDGSSSTLFKRNIQKGLIEQSCR